MDTIDHLFKEYPLGGKNEGQGCRIFLADLRRAKT